MKPTTNAKTSDEPTDIDLEKLRLEERWLEADVKSKMDELAFKREELNAKHTGERKNILFTSPLLAAALTAIVGLLGAGVGAALSGYWNTKLERSKFEFTLIQKALELKDRREAAKNLKFLVDAGVIQSLDSGKISSLADDPTSLPTYSSIAPISAGFSEGMKFKDAIQMISEDTGIAIALTGCGDSGLNAELTSGKVSAGNPVALIEMLKHRIKDPVVKLNYQVKEVSPGSKYEVVCVQ